MIFTRYRVGVTALYQLSTPDATTILGQDSFPSYTLTLRHLAEF
jgi:hypothetical protein